MWHKKNCFHIDTVFLKFSESFVLIKLVLSFNWGQKSLIVTFICLISNKFQR